MNFVAISILTASSPKPARSSRHFVSSENFLIYDFLPSKITSTFSNFFAFTITNGQAEPNINLIPAGRRVIVVGDLHGALNDLMKVHPLLRVEFA
jgi:hypothetical protein